MERCVHKPRTFEKPYLLVVEGKDDADFFEAFLKALSREIQEIKDKFDIFYIEGKKKLPKALEAIKQTPGFNKVDALIIIEDSNSSPDSTLQSIKDSLKKAGLPIPRKATEPSGKKPKVMILLLPDTNKQGMLEDLCLESVKNDPAVNCMENYFNCLKSKGIKIKVSFSKAKCLAFLASRPKVPKNIGIAAHQGVWPFDSPAFDKIKDAIRKIITC
ncbi:MAG: DUF3226 domain-containing protein [Candidatus Saccharicenans sp.]